MALNKKSISTKFNVILKSFESKRYNNLIIHTVMSIYFDHVFTHFYVPLLCERMHKYVLYCGAQTVRIENKMEDDSQLNSKHVP